MAVVKARRLNPPSSVGWEITVQPDGDGTVTIVLPGVLGRSLGARGAAAVHAGAGNGTSRSSRWGTPGVVLELLIAQVARSRRARIMVLAMALLAAALVSSQGEARAATLWTSTLTVQTVGFHNMAVPVRIDRWCRPCSEPLSDHTIRINSRDYTVTGWSVVRSNTVSRCPSRSGAWVPGASSDRLSLTTRPSMPAMTTRTGSW